jgi:hypothetical protein
MRVQINTDRHTEGHERLAAWASGVAEQALNHVSDRITRVEVHLSDESGDRSGQHDQRCLMEARLGGMNHGASCGFGRSASVYRRLWRTPVWRLVGNFTVLNSVAAITALVGEILVATEAHQRQGEFSAL